MLEARLFTSGNEFQQNAYLAVCTEESRALIIDPGAQVEEMLEVVEDEDLEVTGIVLTHAHLDHVEGVPGAREATGAPIWLHPADRPLYDRAGDQAAAFDYPLPGELPDPDRELTHGQTLRVGSCELEVRHAPGHAPGHVILYAADAGLAFVADVIFQRSIGRTDLPGGNFQQLISSIREQVLTLPDDTRLLTGHGPETTVEGERRGNPFLIPHYGGDLA